MFFRNQVFLETIAAYTLIDLILGSLSGSRSLLTEVQLTLRKMTDRFFAKNGLLQSSTKECFLFHIWRGS